LPIYGGCGLAPQRLYKPAVAKRCKGLLFCRVTMTTSLYE